MNELFALPIIVAVIIGATILYTWIVYGIAPGLLLMNIVDRVKKFWESFQTYFGPIEHPPTYKYEYLLPGGSCIIGKEFRIPTSSGGFSELLDGDMVELARYEQKRIQEQEAGPIVVRGPNDAPVVIPDMIRPQVVVAIKRVYEPHRTGPN